MITKNDIENFALKIYGADVPKTTLEVWINEFWNEVNKSIPMDAEVIVKAARGALLPCPFCGSKPKIAITSQIKCSNINCVMSSYVMHDTLWNQRVNSRFSE